MNIFCHKDVENGTFRSIFLYQTAVSPCVGYGFKCHLTEQTTPNGVRLHSDVMQMPEVGVTFE